MLDYLELSDRYEQLLTVARKPAQLTELLGLAMALRKQAEDDVIEADRNLASARRRADDYQKTIGKLIGVVFFDANGCD
jgi:hypothetical protein